MLCEYSQDTKAYSIYNATHSMLKTGNAVFIETPSKVVSPPINEMGNIDGMDDVGIISYHDGPGDDSVAFSPLNAAVNITNRAAAAAAAVRLQLGLKTLRSPVVLFGQPTHHANCTVRVHLQCSQNFPGIPHLRNSAYVRVRVCITGFKKKFTVC